MSEPQRLFDDLADDAEVLNMLRLRKQLDSGAPNAVVIGSDPPRTETARRRQAMEAWKSQQPTANELKGFCVHGCLLSIEICEEGC
jgi:hypothetical protein